MLHGSLISFSLRITSFTALSETLVLLLPIWSEYSDTKTLLSAKLETGSVLFLVSQIYLLSFVCLFVVIF